MKAFFLGLILVLGFNLSVYANQQTNDEINASSTITLNLGELSLDDLDIVKIVVVNEDEIVSSPLERQQTGVWDTVHIYFNGRIPSEHLRLVTVARNVTRNGQVYSGTLTYSSSVFLPAVQQTRATFTGWLLSTGMMQ